LRAAFLLVLRLRLFFKPTRMEKSILKNTVNFQDIFEALPVHFLILKPDAPFFTTVEANHAFLKTAGLNRDDVLHRPLFEVLPKNPGIDLLRLSFEKVLRTQSTDHLPVGQYDLPNPETGVMEEKYWLTKNVPVFDQDHEISYIIHHVEDVSEMVLTEKRRKQDMEKAARELAASNQELEQVNQELDAFTYSVSHDLRAPLRAINGYSQMVMEDYNEVLDADARTYLDTIIHNAMRMGALIDDLLTFSRLSKQPVNKVLLNMSAITDSVVSELRIHAPARLAINVNPLVPAEGDSNMIRLVWSNLISNAIKYSLKKERPSVEIGCMEEDKRVVYYVKDNGVGFDMKYYDKLFGVFNRLHSKHEFDGTGVGLALVDRIVKKHGGEVWGKSTMGEGAIFYFSLPAPGKN
jgi:signal transduction histidine kinase